MSHTIRNSCLIVVCHLFLIGTLLACSGRAISPGPVEIHARPAAVAYATYVPQTGLLTLGNREIEFRWDTVSQWATLEQKSTGASIQLAPACRFQIGDTILSLEERSLSYRSYELGGTPGGGRRLTLLFGYGKPEPQIEVRVEYTVSGSQSGLRKQVQLRNLTDRLLVAGNVQLMRADAAELTWTEPRGNAWRMASFQEGGESSLFWFHEAPSMLRSWEQTSDSLILALPAADADWPTRVRLLPNVPVHFPATHIAFTRATSSSLPEYVSTLLDDMGNGAPLAKAAFVVRVETPIPEIPEPPEEVDLILMDYDWSDEEATLKKIREVASIMRDYGFRFGLRVPLCLYPEANPPWTYRLAGQKPWQVEWRGETRTVYCLGSEYALFIGTVLSDLVQELHLDALVLVGPLFGNASEGITGCTAFDHDHYGAVESAWTAYQNLTLVTQFLRHENPGLLLVGTEPLWGTPFPDLTAFSVFDQVVWESRPASEKSGRYLREYRY